jgi:ligand-binding SRPBCC domain-containing protein
MALILLDTFIHAPLQHCFDLSRSIDFHMRSTAHTGEKAVAGTVSGLIGLHETVTWEARHFGIVQRLTSRITQMESPHSFTDEMTEGAFAWIVHRHSFFAEAGGTLMKDHFSYGVPYGPAGRLFDALVLRRYLVRLLQERNRLLQHALESLEWKNYLTF